ncbi:MAG: hypothetical protein NZ846_09060 [Thermus sp.]|jgi:hypothetical protein|uniref:Uncharacterized protein n=1 Tax=Thermus aquaticus TaxID=271 RepID=A0A0M9AG04_THEAQ|nr:MULTISPECIES: hypothetical protein [Thermus]KOX91198.1 hypothetical protein BVI061214_00088 [Thermus aquaticus]KOX91229.1 hypothetical protein BVI061214_00050 [Thermus aquaticus]MCS7219105.1 hypothetical protein [Thermus sp.]MCX7850561.1 hypothetical protein [Thermus sp.]MDW8357825.1 hypothetical protein [Thermus sp.]
MLEAELLPASSGEKPLGEGFSEGEESRPQDWYFARLELWGTLERKILPPKGKGEGSQEGGRPRWVYVLRDPALGEVPLRFPREVWERIPFWAFQRHLGRTVLARFSPRTNAQGLWSPWHSPALGFSRRPGVEPSRFQARGRLVGVDREEGRLVVEIRPNPQGVLKEPFRLTLHAALALLEGLPSLGSGVYLEGELRPKSRRMVVRKAELVPLWDD